MTSHAVLVVDDDRLTRESLCEMLDDLGCLVHDADCGLAALKRLQAESHDLVVSDVDMPDISGFELLARMHAANIHSPTVLMSARATSDMQRLAIEAGATECFAKPVQLDPFVQCVRRILHP